MGSPHLEDETGGGGGDRLQPSVEVCSLWAECKPPGVDVLHLNIGFTATPAMARLGIEISVAEAPEKVAQLLHLHFDFSR